MIRTGWMRAPPPWPGCRSTPLPRVAPGSPSLHESVAPAPPEDFHDADLGVRDQADGATFADPKSVLYGMGALEFLDVRARARTNGVFAERLKGIDKAFPFLWWEVIELLSCRLGGQDPPHQRSSSGVNFSSRKMRFHRSSIALSAARSMS